MRRNNNSKHHIQRGNQFGAITNNKKNKSIARIKMDETSGNRIRNRKN